MPHSAPQAVGIAASKEVEIMEGREKSSKRIGEELVGRRVAVAVSIVVADGWAGAGRSVAGTSLSVLRTKPKRPRNLTRDLSETRE